MAYIISRFVHFLNSHSCFLAFRNDGNDYISKPDGCFLYCSLMLLVHLAVLQIEIETGTQDSLLCACELGVLVQHGTLSRCAAALHAQLASARPGREESKEW
jgi:hypothetical protein